MGHLDGRVAFITGSASGIGAAAALRLGEEGAALAGFDLNEADGGDWAAAVDLAPASTFAAGDVRYEDDLSAAVAAAKEEHGRIDILVNSAGVGGGAPVHMLPTEEWDRVVDINLKGTFLASRAVLPTMLEQERGSIVNLASVEGIEGFPAASAYNASKGGVILLTRNMSIDYARKGIRVNAVCPGFIDTPLLAGIFATDGMEETLEEIREAHQLGRLGEAREIANAIAFLAGDEASFITGIALPVDGGYTAGHRYSLTKLLGLE